MPPRKHLIDRNYSDMVDPNALHITPEQAAVFGEDREVLKTAEVNALREKAAQSDQLSAQLEELRAQIQSRTSDLLVQDGTLVVHDFQFTPTGLIAPETFSEEAWKQVGVLILKLEGSIQWLIGDWIVYGGQVGWGDLPKLAEALNYELQTLYNYSSTCRAIKSWIRIQDLSFAHHRLVVSLSQEEQAKALAYALEQRYSIAKFRQWLHENYRLGDRKNRPALPSELKFRAIADELDKFALRDPVTAKPKDKAALQAYTVQMRTWLDALEKKWGIE